MPVQVPGKGRGPAAPVKDKRADTKDGVSERPGPRERCDEGTVRTALTEILAQLPDVSLDTSDAVTSEHCRNDQRYRSLTSRSTAARRRHFTVSVCHAHVDHADRASNTTARSARRHSPACLVPAIDGTSRDAARESSSRYIEASVKPTSVKDAIRE